MSEFRYTRLIEVKEKLLEQKQRQLDEAISAVRAVIEDIERIQKEIDDGYNEIVSKCLTGKEFSAITDYLNYLDIKKSGLIQEKAQREKRVEVVRTELKTLAIEMKMLEKLQIKAAARVRKERNRKEQKFMDDLAMRTEL